MKGRVAVLRAYGGEFELREYPVPDVEPGAILVKLTRAGVEIKMSKRSGEFVTLREVADEVGRDAVRFMMLYRKNDAVLDFDLAKVIEQSRDNPVFYVQYGHARGHSVFRNAGLPDFPDGAAESAAYFERAQLHRLDDSAELSLMRKLALYPRLVEAAALAFSRLLANETAAWLTHPGVVERADEADGASRASWWPTDYNWPPACAFAHRRRCLSAVFYGRELRGRAPGADRRSTTSGMAVGQ